MLNSMKIHTVIHSHQRYIVHVIMIVKLSYLSFMAYAGKMMIQYHGRKVFKHTGQTNNQQHKSQLF